MLNIILIVVLIVGGLVIHTVSKKDDTPAEQLVENILRSENVNIDFSEGDKKETAIEK